MITGLVLSARIPAKENLTKFESFERCLLRKSQYYDIVKNNGTTIQVPCASCNGCPFVEQVVLATHDVSIDLFNENALNETSVKVLNIRDCGIFLVFGEIESCYVKTDKNILVINQDSYNNLLNENVIIDNMVVVSNVLIYVPIALCVCSVLVKALLDHRSN